ncbi:MAG: peptide ABC transporter substrate-binding protein [Oscillibacter sp.]|nr:peptide ABC transporter substrate-binding protein [Oscillibacter sp.]
MKKKFLCLALALTMLLSLVACGGNNDTPAANPTPDTPPAENNTPSTPDTPDEPAADAYTGPDWAAIDAMDYEDASDAIYDFVLGEFADAYAVAKQASGDERAALMAIAEAKLMESGVFMPIYTQGGNYAMSRVVTRTSPTVLWGMDEYRYYKTLVCNELIKLDDVNALKALWAAAEDEAAYFEAAKAYLDEHGYTLTDTYVTNTGYNLNIWDTIATSYTSDAMFIAGTYDNLLEYDVKGVQQPCLATSYDVSPDGTVYTFHIREGVKWVDQQGTEIGEVTADDWVASMEHLLDNAAALGYLLTVSDGCGLKNFDAYLQGEATLEDIGVKALDKYTLEYTLEAPFPAFPTMLGYSIFAPMNRDFYRSQGGTFSAEGEEYTAGDYGKTPSNIAYCGPYLVTSYTAQNTTRYAANPTYWNADAVNCKNLVYNYNDGSDPLRSYNDAKSGAASGAGFNTSAVQQAKIDIPDGETQSYFELYAYVTSGRGTTFGGWKNVHRAVWNNFDNDSIGVSPKRDNAEEIARTRDAMVNQHFRLAMGMAFDKASYNAQSVGEELKLAALRNSYTPATFVYLADDVTVDINGTATTFAGGTAYGEIMQAQLDADGYAVKVWDPNGDGGAGSGDGFDGWYNVANAKAELELAIAELAQIGVEISADKPIHIDYPYQNTADVYRNMANVVKQSVEGALDGMVIIDLIAMDKDTDMESATYRFEAGNEGNFDLSTNSGWGPDYGDAQSFLDTIQAGGYMCKNIGLY